MIDRDSCEEECLKFGGIHAFDELERDVMRVLHFYEWQVNVVRFEDEGSTA